MLVLTRKIREAIVLSGGVTIQVIDIKGDKVRLGVVAPKDVAVHRVEVAERIGFEGRKPLPPKTKLEPALADCGNLA